MTDPGIYLDHAATTPLRPEARAAMEPFLGRRFGNTSSVHTTGREARMALEDARERVADLLGARPDEILFTSGGTEADNLAVLGHWRAMGRPVVVSAVEHSAVRSAAAQAAREGAAVTTVGVDEGGRLDLDALDEALADAPALVSVMWANNEVGTLQPVEEIARRCQERGASFHTDAVQAVGHQRVSVADVPCDLLALSGHKLGGPQGVGALYVRSGTRLDPLVHGGGQERGLRPGTTNLAGAVGLAAAMTAAHTDLAGELDRLAGLRDRLQHAIIEGTPSITEGAPGVTVNGAPDRLPHILHLSVDAVAPDVLLPALDMAGLSISAGSACHSGASAPSHVLLAMGRGGDAVVRFSLGWPTTPADVDEAATRFLDVLARVRSLAA